MHCAPAAAGAEAHDRIRTVAEAHALQIARSFAPDGAQVSVEAANLDPRLALPACPVPPEAFDSPALRPGPYLSIGVRCPAASGAASGWSLYVPVQVHVTAQVVVLAAAVARGDMLDKSDLRLESRDVSRLNGGYLTQLQQVEGMVLKRPVRPGTALSTNLLQAATLVHRGQRVRLLASMAGFTVTTEGEALADASVGERVRVRNLGSDRVVEGTVDASGQVHTGG